MEMIRVAECPRAVKYSAVRSPPARYTRRSSTVTIKRSQLQIIDMNDLSRLERVLLISTDTVSPRPPPINSNQATRIFSPATRPQESIAIETCPMALREPSPQRAARLSAASESTLTSSDSRCSTSCQVEARTRCAVPLTILTTHHRRRDLFSRTGPAFTRCSHHPAARSLHSRSARTRISSSRRTWRVSTAGAC